MALINCPECNKQISDKAEICVGCGAPVEKLVIVIGIPIQIGNLEIAQNDFPIQMSYDGFFSAKKAFAELGDNWRLPTKDELNILYQNQAKIGGFKESNYWSSSEDLNELVWTQLFGNSSLAGRQNKLIKSADLSVRAVRSF
jgi:hypothetical protein